MFGLLDVVFCQGGVLMFVNNEGYFVIFQNRT